MHVVGLCQMKVNHLGCISSPAKMLVSRVNSVKESSVVLSRINMLNIDHLLFCDSFVQ